MVFTHENHWRITWLVTKALWYKHQHVFPPDDLRFGPEHYIDVIMGAIASQITSLTIVYSTVYSGADQRKHQSSASLAFVRGIHRTGEFPAQMASNAENVSIWWRHHELNLCEHTRVLWMHPESLKCAFPKGYILTEVGIVNAMWASAILSFLEWFQL